MSGDEKLEEIFKNILEACRRDLEAAPNSHDD